MPELPEVETTRRGIEPFILQQKISQVIVRDRRLRWPITNHLDTFLVNKKILAVKRRGKYLLLQFSHGHLLIHLGMSGHLRILSQVEPITKHAHVDILLANQKLLRFTDPRRFGAILWVTGDPQEHVLLKKLTMEPLTRQFSGRYLHQLAQGKKVSIKAFIMDNHIVTGIGNIYATEALFAAKIYPGKSVCNVTLKQFNSLVTCIKKILRRAIQCGGTTLKDFADSDGKPGYFYQQLKVYGRGNLPCVICQCKLSVTKTSNRRTVYCRNCQR